MFFRRQDGFLAGRCCASDKEIWRMEPIRVLVVDDELFVGDLMQEYLTLSGYSVTTASNGKDALAAFSEIKPHVVVLDIRMPGMSGMEVLKTIKQNSPETGVVMLSAYGDPETIVEALGAGADHYLQKPVNLKHLVETLALLHLQPK